MSTTHPSARGDAEEQSADLVEFADEPANMEIEPSVAPWIILMVDDDPDVHSATLHSMQGIYICGHPLHFLHAYTAMQAREFVAEREDIAVIMLDVVMETDDAGLKLVNQIRGELGRSIVQIILRTGQPGFAPEIETIRQYEINDYRTKTELTQVRLYTTLSGAIRTYQHLHSMAETRRGLEVVVHASTELSRARGLHKFSEGLITQLCALLQIKPDGIVCAKVEEQRGGDATIIVATGIHAPLVGKSVAQLEGSAIGQVIKKSLDYRANIFDACTVLYFPATNGQSLVAFVDTVPLKEIDQQLIQAFCSSMTVGLENILLHERMFSLAYKDQLLGVANRNRFLDLLQARMQGSPGITLAVIDLDDFAGDITMFGHAFGDALLKAFVARLIDQVGSEVDLGRISGDAFALVGRDEFVNPQALAGCTAAILKVQQQMVTVSATCGLVRLDSGNSDGAEVLKQAHVALKLAKSQYRGASVYYNDEMGTDAAERSALLRRLREAFEADRLFVVYQPQVRLADRSIVGAEALLRWRSEEGLFVPPDLFIPVAEKSGLMVTIGEFVLRSACHQLKKLNEAGFADFRMSVNVSQAQFRDPRFVQTVKRALVDSGVSAVNLELEITESMAAEDLDFVLSVLHELKSAGVTIAIDDFGTGYSSLSILGRLPLDRLKIDKSFVDDLGVTEGVAKSIIDIGRSLKLELIAEGVEKAEQADALHALGCQEGQGYFYACPLPADALHPWLASR